jgi:(E)-4-hydroxy-3-methylbut-2-enyl-diphosphate synthase
LAERVEKFLEKLNKPVKVAVMGCVVNGPGEGKEADIGVAGGHGKAVIFAKGKILKTVPEKDIFKTLEEEINKIVK